MPRMNASSDFPAEIDCRAVEHRPDTRIVTVAGEIDTPSGRKLASFLTAQLTVAQVVIVDLNGVKILGPVGLSTLFDVNELAIQKGRTLRLVCNSRAANRALEAAGLREYFTFADSVPDAVQNSPRLPGVIGTGSARRRHRRRRSLRRDSTVSRRAAASTAPYTSSAIAGPAVAVPPR